MTDDITSRRISLESKILLKLLDDGQWHPIKDIMDKLCPAIAPGKALRRYEAMERNRELHHGPRKTPELADDNKIRSGQKAIAVDIVASLKKRYIEITDTDDGRYIRRRQQVVPYAEYGQPPPQPTTQRPADDGDTGPAATVDASVAFFSEDQVRDIVHQEVCSALDDFQSGMQVWLTEQFTQLQTTTVCRANPAHWPPTRSTVYHR